MVIPGVIASVLAACAQTQAPKAPVPQFTDEQRSAVMKYWSEPGRYVVAPPKDYATKGLWQVRLTTAGSVWLYNLNKARGAKMIPTQDSTGSGESQKGWDAWIDAKINHDRWSAAQTAAQANRLVLSLPSTWKDPKAPATEPPDPGPMPDALFAIAGDAPPLAEAVVPMSHTIKFDDGTVVGYSDNVGVRPKYAYYRFEKGVGTEGTAVKGLPSDKLDALFKKAGVSPAEARVMKAVSMLEGGFDAVNTYDTGFVSVGFIQFASLKDGANSLGKMLLSYKADDASSFEQDFRRFGIDVTPAGSLDVVDPGTGAEVVGGEAAKRIIEDKRLIAVFSRAGMVSDVYNAQQIKAAKAMYYPADDTIDLGGGAIAVVGKVSDFIKSEAGMATLMDRKVNTGKLDPLIPILQQIASEFDIKSFADFSTFEYQIVAQLKYRKDYLADASLSQPTAVAKTRPATKASRAGTRQGRGSGTVIGGKKSGGG